jgi:hypothetical protein
MMVVMLMMMMTMMIMMMMIPLTNLVEVVHVQRPALLGRHELGPVLPLQDLLPVVAAEERVPLCNKTRTTARQC